MVNRLLKGLKKHGLNGSARIARELLRNGCYRTLCGLVKAPAWRDPTEDERREIERALQERGARIENLVLSPDELTSFMTLFQFGDDFYGGQSDPVYREKVLEHFIAYKLVVSRISPDDIYIDVAAANSPWTKLLRSQGMHAFAIDINRSTQFGHLDYYLTGDATRTAFADGSVSGISLQCAFEMFSRDDDIRLIREIGRILKKGGRAAISPLYLHTHYSGFSSPDYYFKKCFHASSAKLYLAPAGMTGIPFARFYDPVALQQRILDTITASGLQYRISVLRNGSALGDHIYCTFILELSKEPV